MKHTIQSSQKLAQGFIDFVNKSKTAYHAVSTIRQQLLDRGYVHLDEKSSWTNTVQRNGKYFMTRNQSAILVLSIGGKYSSGGGWKIVGAHTDSPDLRLKPISKQEKGGLLQVGVQTYGGGLFHTWFDRDLTVSGRVLVKSSSSSTGGAQPRFESKLVTVDRPILRIPSLAIHLNRDVKEGFKFNYETHLVPIISSAVNSQLNVKVNNTSNASSSSSNNGGGDSEEKTAMQVSHHSVLLDVLAQELNCSVNDIVDMELSVVDVQPAVIGGALNEFIFSPRLDNLMSCFCSLQALFNTEDSLNEDNDIRVVALFDHEEVGSDSCQGAGSAWMNDIFVRLTKLLGNTDENSNATPVDALEMAKAKSFLISADMAHALHPNYTEKHTDTHRPEIHKGLVVKVNANQRYTTNAHSSLLMRQLASSAGVPLQQFVVRNDSLCGSTIGPIISSGVGIRAVDVGIPQLSMHSIREMCGTVDAANAVDLFTEFFKPSFRQLDDSIQID